MRIAMEGEMGTTVIAEDSLLKSPGFVSDIYVYVYTRNYDTIGPHG